MAKYEVTAPDGKKYQIEGEGTQQEALDYFKQQWSAQPQQAGMLETKAKKRVSGGVDDYVRAGFQGATFGFGDEIVAGLGSLKGLVGKGSVKDEYNRRLASERAKLEAFKEDSPIASLGLEVAGGVLPAIATMGGSLAPSLARAGFLTIKSPLATQGAQKLFQQGSRFGGTSVGRGLENVAQSGVGQAVLKGARSPMGQVAKQGAGYGALAGAGLTDTKEEDDFLSSLGDRFGGAALGGATGAVLAPALGYGATALGRGAGAALGHFRGTGSSSLNRAQDEIIKNLADDGMSIGRLERLAKRDAMLGAESRFYDTGENIGSLAQTVSSKKGRGKTDILGSTQNRIDDAREHVADKVKSIVDKDGKFYSTMEDLDFARKTASKPFYEKAYAGKPINNPWVNKMLHENPHFKNAWKQAQQLADDDAGLLRAKYEERIMNATTDKERSLLNAEMQRELAGLKLPDISTALGQSKGSIPVKQLDYVNRAMSNMVQDSFSASATSAQKQMGRGIKDLQKTFNGIVEKNAPDLAEARKIHRGTIESQEALKAGTEAFNAKNHPDAIKKMFGELNDADKDFFRMGMKEALLAKIENTSSRRDFSTVFGQNSRLMQKIEATFDNPADFRKFERGLKREAELLMSARKIATGSPTQPRLASERNYDQATSALTHIVDAMNPTPVKLSALKGAYRGAKDYGKNLTRGDKVTDDLSQMLNTPMTSKSSVTEGFEVNPAFKSLLDSLKLREKGSLDQVNSARNWRQFTGASPLAGLGAYTESPYGYSSSEQRAHGGLIQLADGGLAQLTRRNLRRGI